MNRNWLDNWKIAHIILLLLGIIISETLGDLLPLDGCLQLSVLFLLIKQTFKDKTVWRNLGNRIGLLQWGLLFQFSMFGWDWQPIKFLIFPAIILILAVIKDIYGKNELKTKFSIVLSTSVETYFVFIITYLTCWKLGFPTSVIIIPMVYLYLNFFNQKLSKIN